ncbi:MAG: T9SS type A sorting domain-containing protein [Bacteroidota bacterium]
MLRYTLLTAIALTATGLAAQHTQPFSIPAQPSVLEVPRGGAEVLYDQTGAPSENNFPSQQAGGSEVQYDAQGADDFVVPDTVAWSITELAVLGAYVENATPIEIADIYFYANVDGRPDSLIERRLNVPVDSIGDGDLAAALSPSVILTEGTYWASLVVDVPPSLSGQWRWNRQDTAEPIGFEMHWRNPRDGFRTGCTGWQPLTTNCVGGGMDASFRLSGRASDAFVRFDPAVLTDTLSFGPDSFGSETVILMNDTDQSVAFSFPETSGGFVVGFTPAQDTIPANGSAEVVVDFDATGLAPSTYEDSFSVDTDLGPEGLAFDLPVRLIIPMPVAQEDGAARQAFALRRGYPNPFAEQTTVELVLPEAGSVTVEVYDALGRRVAVLADGERAAGLHRLRWDAREASSGAYFVRAQAGAKVSTVPVVVVR